MRTGNKAWISVIMRAKTVPQPVCPPVINAAHPFAAAASLLRIRAAKESLYEH